MLQAGDEGQFPRCLQEEQHRSHENCLDAASDDLLDLQRNLPERRGRSRELEEYRLRKEYLEYEVRARGCPLVAASPPAAVASHCAMPGRHDSPHRCTRDTLMRAFPKFKEKLYYS